MAKEMKSKDAYDTACMGGAGHKHLGHFAQRKYINAGHNTNPLSTVVSKVIEGAGRAMNTERGRALKDADAAVAQPKTDTTKRRKTLDKAIEGGMGDQD